MGDRMDGFGRLLSLVHELAGSVDGLTIEDMAHHLGQGRRTAERMRDIIALHFDLEELADGRRKRFRIRDGLPRQYTKPSADEIAALKAESEAALDAGSPRGAVLEALYQKIWSSFDRAGKLRLDPDVSALASVQRTFIGPGPYAPAEPETLGTICQSIMSGCCVEFDYAAEGRSQAEWRRVIPLGILHGPISYLVGKMPGRDEPPVLYRLDRMTDIRLSDIIASPPEMFDLDDWLAHSFGIWRDAQHEVVLRARPECAKRAMAWRFHPKQTLQHRDDGTIVIRFRASGLQELADHIFSWGGGLEILGPPELHEVLMERIDLARAALVSAPGQPRFATGN